MSIFDPKPPGIYTPMVDIDMSHISVRKKIWDIINLYVGTPLTKEISIKVRFHLLGFLRSANHHRYPEIDINKIDVQITSDVTILAVSVFYAGERVNRMDEDGFIYLEEEV